MWIKELLQIEVQKQELQPIQVLLQGAVADAAVESIADSIADCA